MTKSENSLKVIYNQFIQFEEDNQLFSRKVDGIFFWERIRFTVFMKIFLSLTNSKDSVQTGRSDKSFRLMNYLLKFRNYFLSTIMLRRNPFLVRNREIIYFSNSRRKIQDDGYWWDIYIDHLENKLGYSSVLLEKDLFFKYRKPAKTEKMVYHTYIDFLVDLKKYFKLSRLKFESDEKKYILDLEQEIESIFSLKIDIKSLVYHNLTKRKREIPLYNRLLKRIKPKAVIVVCSYGKENFIEVCKSNAIPVIELQHGVITKYHTGYSYEKDIAKKHTFPDFLFSFGNYWRETVTFPIPKERIFNVGFPELEIRKKQYQRVKKQKQILFISQKTIGALLSKFAVELSQLKELDYKIIYKLHPFEVLTWQKDYPWLLNSNIEVVDHQGDNLYQLFAKSEILVGVYSTAIFEGLSFDLKTFLIDIAGIDYMEDLIKAGVALKVNKPMELIKLISHKDSEKFDTESFFMSNATNNIKTALDKIISES